MSSSLLIGTSGWVYKHWRGVFYPHDLPFRRWLAFYAEHFRTVEVNNSFYCLPKRETFQAWKSVTPAVFVFAVKGNRFITHQKKLKDVGEPLERFFRSVSGLGRKVKVILWQLPPTLKADAGRLAALLSQLPRRYRHSVEFRHPSWWTDEAVFRVLEHHNAAFCIASAPTLPKRIITTANFAYVRMHGWDGMYSGCYPETELKWWVGEIRQMLCDGLDVFVYFNNDAFGFAVQNAKQLALML